MDAVEKIVGEVFYLIDFGDVKHILKFAEASTESPEKMLEMVQVGIEASGRYTTLIQKYI